MSRLRRMTRNETVRCPFCREWFVRRFPCSNKIVQRRCPACGEWHLWRSSISGKPVAVPKGTRR